MISDFKVIKMTDNRYRIRAIKEHREDQFLYMVTFKPAESSLNMDLTISDVVKTYLNYDNSNLNNPQLGSPDFNIKRGLYDVYIARIKEITNGQAILEEGSLEKYPRQIMVGDKYKIVYRMKEDISFGRVPGIRVKIQSMEHNLDGKTIYYMIHRDKLEGVKYYIPFNDQRGIDFFIQDITMNEFVLGTENDSFEIVQG